MGGNGDGGMNLQARVVDEIRRFVAESPHNRLKDIDGSPIFEEPLVGFADGDDPLFDLYKAVVGPFHFTPREALATADGACGPIPRVAVVSWVLPVSRETRLSNRRMKDGPSLRWNNTRFQGEDFNERLREHVVGFLREHGHLATAPFLANLYKVNETPTGRAATWSERHAAYAAGLGTFSLTDALITEKGLAHRCGSAVTTAPFEPTERPYTYHLEYCRHFRTGKCGDCIKRCPAGAITEAGHDRRKCHEHLFVTQLDWVKRPGYIGSYGGCGLCLTGVPCESRIPR